MQAECSELSVTMGSAGLASRNRLHEPPWLREGPALGPRRKRFQFAFLLGTNPTWSRMRRLGEA